MASRTKEQEDNDDFGRLLRPFLVSDETGRERTDDDAGYEVPDQRRQLQPISDTAENKRRSQSAGEGQQHLEIALSR